MKKVARYELIGLAASVVDAKNKSLIGKQGVIIDETKSTLTLQESHKASTLLKNQILLRLKINNTEVELDGKELSGRPEERLKKKLS